MDLGLVATFFSGLFGGILFSSFFDLGWSFALLFLLLSFVLFLMSRTPWELSSQTGKVGRIFVPLFLLAFALGIFRFDLADTRGDLSSPELLEGRTIKVEGVVINEPKEKDKTTNFVASVDTGDGAILNVLVKTKPYTKYSYGDRVTIYGQLEKIRNFSTDFDYVSYLAKDEIYYQFLNPKIILNPPLNIGGRTSDIQRGLFDFKNSFLEKINLKVSEPEASLMGGILVGAKSSLDRNLLDNFKKVGLIHIVALSGYNISVIADNLMKLIWFMPLSIRLTIGSLAIVLFAMMTGGGSTVVRASIMVLLAMLARATGRVYLAGSALLTAATLMVLYDPKILVFDISFQLSFLATAGLILFTPILEKYLKFLPDRFNIRGGLVSTLAAQLAVWPLILYKMGSFSLVSIPANLLVGPIIPATMFFGFLTGLVGFVNYHLSLVFSYISYVFLFYIIKVTELFSSLSFASISISSFPLSLTIMIYFFYIVAVLVIKVDPTAGE